MMDTPTIVVLVLVVVSCLVAVVLRFRDEARHDYIVSNIECILSRIEHVMNYPQVTDVLGKLNTFHAESYIDSIKRNAQAKRVTPVWLKPNYSEKLIVNSVLSVVDILGTVGVESKYLIYGD